MKIKYAMIILAVFFLSASAGAGPAPAEKPLATVLSTKIYAGDLEPDPKTLESLKKSVPEARLPETVAEYRLNRLRELIWQPLKKQLVEESNIRVSDKDLDDFVKAVVANEKEAREAYEKKLTQWQEELRKEGLTAAKKAELEQRINGLKAFLSAGKEKQLNAYREIGRKIVETWKVDRQLYFKFGGTVVARQTGPEPIGAYRVFLEREEKDKKFEIYQKELRDGFWEYYSRKQPLAIPEDKVDFIDPWWLSGKAK